MFPVAAAANRGRTFGREPRLFPRFYSNNKVAFYKKYFVVSGKDYSKRQVKWLKTRSRSLYCQW
jgi:hypothetical protein